MRVVLLIPALAVIGAGALPDPQQDPHPGQRTFDTVCAVCHSVKPPPNQAPPMAHIARHYREAAPGDTAAAITRLAEWIAHPDSGRSLLPAMARERFGLMAPLPLPEAERRAVASYVLTLDDGAAAGPGPGAGMGMGGGQGMGHRHGAPPDTATAGG